MSRTFDVCIRGDGVVGRTLALLLAQARLRVALVGQSDDEPAVDMPDVRAYALNAASRRTLEAVRAWPDASAATAVHDMQVWGDDGGRVDFDTRKLAGRSEPGALAWIVDVPALQARLLEASRYQPQIERIGEPAQAALTVFCEGGNSSGRETLDLQWDLTSYSQHAIAARLDAEHPHGGTARQWFSGGEVLALLPMGGNVGHSLALVWSVSSTRAEVLRQVSDELFCAELQSICGAQTGTLRVGSPRSAWPLTLAKATRWVGPGWALAGDAAHTVHPLAGQGLNLGLADAAGLAQTLAAREYWRELGDERLLRRYERARKGDLAAVSAVTDGLQNLFSQDGDIWQSLRNRGMSGFGRIAPLKSWVVRQAAGS